MGKKAEEVPERLEDYLEKIFEFEIQGIEPTITGLAKRLGITKGAATLSVKRMASLDLLTHEHYGQFRLTDKGYARGLQIYRRHEHLSFLFSEMLGIPRKEAEAVACSMEHVMREESEQRLLAFAEFYCTAHRNGEEWTRRLQNAMESHSCLPRPLPLLAPREKGRIVRITALNPLRGRMLTQGLMPDEVITFLQMTREGDAQILLGGKEIILKRGEAASLWVCPLECPRSGLDEVQ
ncbi:MAG: DtxR family transcriptional regulator [Thermovirgaceae bacterium]